MAPNIDTEFTGKTRHELLLRNLSAEKVKNSYFASAFLRILILPLIVSFIISACSSSRLSKSAGNNGYQLIFDGKTLNGWQYDPVYWRADNGVLTGEVTPSTLLKRNTFIIKKNLVTRNFDLKVEYRV